MRTIIVSADIVSLFFMLILFFGSMTGSYRREKSALLFRACLVIAMVGSLADAISYASVDPRRGIHFVLLTNIVSYLMCTVLLVIFAFYMVSVIETRESVPMWYIYPVLVFFGLYTIQIIYCSFNGKLMYVKNGYIVAGDWGPYAGIILDIAIVYMFFLLFHFKKALDPPQIMAMGAFLLYPIVDSIAVYFFGTDVTYTFIGMAFLIVYVIIQEQAVAEAGLRKTVYEEDAYTDPDTRFKNRHSFDEAIKIRERGRINGVFYSRLKNIDEINEKDGSEAVDNYIIRFADILKECFANMEICRVTDREFAVFLHRTTDASLEKKASMVDEAMAKSGVAASYGYVCAKGVSLSDMISTAQKKMRD